VRQRLTKRRPARTLRLRLLAILLATLVVGVAAIDVATVSALRSFLLSRVDATLAAAIVPAANDVVLHPGQFDARLSLPPGSWGTFVYANGSTVTAPLSPVLYVGEQAPPLTRYEQGRYLPAVPLGRPVTVHDPLSDLAYRVLAVSLPELGGTMVVAEPLTSVDDTVDRLGIAALLVSLGVTISLGIVGWGSIQLGLSPLERMRRRAQAISAGDTHARVDESGPAEVEALARALNTMLARLQSAYATSEASRERLRQFIADVSHELRTPLASIQGYLELVARSGYDPEVAQMAIQRSLEQSQRMRSLVEDLLSLARMDQNLPLELAPVELGELVAQAVADARVVDDSRPIKVEDPGGLMVLGDRNRLMQVLANLLANVRTHTPPGTSVLVRLESVARSAPLPEGALAPREVGDLFGGVDATIAMLEWDEKVRVSVSDTGPGMTPVVAAHVFERFYRAEESRSRLSGGAGLGLALVAAIVHAHGGTAWVYSAGPGRGSTFGFDLPRLRLEDTEDDTVTLIETTSRPLREAGASGGGREARRILDALRRTRHAEARPGETPASRSRWQRDEGTDVTSENG